MQARDGLGDGQAEAAAFRLRRTFRGRAVEALQHALTLGGRDAGAAVVHRQDEMAGRAQHLHVHRAAFGRVLDGVVDQIAQQDGQGLRVAGHGGVLGLRVDGRQAQVDGARLRGGGSLRHGLACQIGQRHGLRGRAHGGLRLVPGQGQELLHQARGAVDAGGQALGGVLARGGVGRALQGLGLQLERGQG
jgi:hypothetical protein